MAQVGRRFDAFASAISPGQNAVVFGPGKVVLLDGRQSWVVTEKEMRRLVVLWLANEVRRGRAPAVDAIVADAAEEAERPSEG